MQTELQNLQLCFRIQVASSPAARRDASRALTVPMTSAKSADPARSATAAPGVTTPAGPAGPVGPIAPAAPAGPAGPVGPIAPAAPAGPAGPVGPIAPAAPVGPAGPVGPIAPAAPAGPAGPVGPIRPAGPCGPGQPQHPHQQGRSGGRMMFMFSNSQSAMISSYFEFRSVQELAPRYFMQQANIRCEMKKSHRSQSSDGMNVRNDAITEQLSVPRLCPAVPILHPDLPGPCGRKRPTSDRWAFSDPDRE